MVMNAPYRFISLRLVKAAPLPVSVNAVKIKTEPYNIVKKGSDIKKKQNYY